MEKYQFGAAGFASNDLCETLSTAIRSAKTRKLGQEPGACLKLPSLVADTGSGAGTRTGALASGLRLARQRKAADQRWIQRGVIESVVSNPNR